MIITLVWDWALGIVSDADLYFLLLAVLNLLQVLIRGKLKRTKHVAGVYSVLSDRVRTDVFMFHLCHYSHSTSLEEASASWELQ